jgi:O-acetylhomoserine/O-acetylserine sulfhydrylase-like pyridoxal-dependent enzyme
MAYDTHNSYHGVHLHAALWQEAYKTKAVAQLMRDMG